MLPHSVFCPICGAQTPRGICPQHGLVGAQPVPTYAIFQAGAIVGGRYRIDHVLSQDQNHTVVLASQLDVHRVVIIKTVAVERLAQRAHELAQLFRESHAVSIFRRGKLVRILDFVIEPMTQTPFLVMEYQPGRSIAEIILPTSMESRTVASFVEVAHGLLDAHDEMLSQGLEPSNSGIVLKPGDLNRALPSGTARPTSGAQAVSRPPSPSHQPSPPPRKKAKRSRWESKWARIGAPLGVVLAVVIYVATTEEYIHSSVGLQRKPGRVYAWNEQPGQPQGYQNEDMYKDGLRPSPLIRIQSTPAGAEIFQGSRLLGQTPFSMKRPTDGMRVVIKFPGYLDKSITINNRSPGTVSASLLRSSTHSSDSLIKAKGRGYGIKTDTKDSKDRRTPSLFEPRDKPDPFEKDPLHIPELPGAKKTYFDD